MMHLLLVGFHPSNCISYYELIFPHHFASMADDNAFYISIMVHQDCHLVTIPLSFINHLSQNLEPFHNTATTDECTIMQGQIVDWMTRHHGSISVSLSANSSHCFSFQATFLPFEDQIEELAILLCRQGLSHVPMMESEKLMGEPTSTFCLSVVHQISIIVHDRNLHFKEFLKFVVAHRSQTLHTKDSIDSILLLWMSRNKTEIIVSPAPDSKISRKCFN